MAPCLAKSLTHAPSRPTTSGSVLDAAPDTNCCFVDAYGPLSSLTLIFGFWAVNSDMSLSNDPAGSSGAHHCANSSVTVPSPLDPALDPELEPQPTAVAPSITTAITPSSRLVRPCNRVLPPVIATSLLYRFYRSLLVSATLTTYDATPQDLVMQNPARNRTLRHASQKRHVGAGGAQCRTLGEAASCPKEAMLCGSLQF